MNFKEDDAVDTEQAVYPHTTNNQSNWGSPFFKPSITTTEYSRASSPDWNPSCSPASVIPGSV
jgi:hypothetical protein